MPQGFLNRYAGHLEIRNGKTGKHYQLVIECPRNPVTGKRQRQYETVLLAKREAERLLHQRIAEILADQAYGMGDFTLMGVFRLNAQHIHGVADEMGLQIVAEFIEKQLLFCRVSLFDAL